MKSTRHFLFVLAGFFALHLAHANTEDTKDNTRTEPTIEEEVTALIRNFDKAVLERDLASLESYLADDFIMITPIGSVLSREQLLMPFQPDRTVKSQLVAAETADFIIHTYEYSAVVSAITSHTFEASSNRPVSKYRNTYTIIKNGDHWQIAAIHGFKLSN
ncbi:MAG: nuclear transport factor 2 family protein [Roseivirga sp.]|nr:nuclear transport factor 2 family protein [Roseivirga sp.]